jgi:hypothetical protein
LPWIVRRDDEVVVEDPCHCGIHLDLCLSLVTICADMAKFGYYLLADYNFLVIIPGFASWTIAMNSSRSSSFPK